MSPVTDTIGAAIERWPLWFVFWGFFAVLPIAIPLAVAVFRRPRLKSPAKFATSAAARIVGYPAVLALLIVVPWVAFELLLVPVLFDAYPNSKSVLSFPLGVTHWVLWNAFWLVPLSWLAWVIAASIYYLRCWHARG